MKRKRKKKREGRKIKEWQKGEMRHIGISLLIEEIVELSYERRLKELTT